MASNHPTSCEAIWRKDAEAGRHASGYPSGMRSVGTARLWRWSGKKVRDLAADSRPAERTLVCTFSRGGPCQWLTPSTEAMSASM